MSGPSNSDREELVERLKSREFWAQAFGWSVGVGLIIEFGKDIADCFIHWHWPSLDLIGGLIVTGGVLGEVIFSGMAAKITEEISSRADSDVALAKKASAEANERVAELTIETERLRKENNETALLLSYRSLGNSEKFVQAMSAFPGTRYKIRFLAGSQETAELQWRLNILLTNAGWVAARNPQQQANTQFGIEVWKLVDQFSREREYSPAAEALVEWLNSSGSWATSSLIGTNGDDPEIGTLVVVIGQRPETLEQYNFMRRAREAQLSQRASKERPVTSPQA